MTKNTWEGDVKVLAVYKMQDYGGEAILAHPDPRFVVALMLSDSKSEFEAQDSDVRFTTYPVAFFAIHSLSKLFRDPNVVEKT